jgi:hypothetical protein
MDLSDGSDPLLLENSVLVQPTETRIYAKHKTSIYSHALLLVCAVLAILTIGIGAIVHSRNDRTNYIFTSISTVFGTAFVCGLTCFLALKCILRPWCNWGRENEMRELVETLFTQYIFSSQVIHGFIDQKAAGLLDPEFVQSTVRTTLESPAFLRLIDETIDNFFRSPEGVALEMLGLSKSGLSPFVVDAVDSIVLSKCAGVVSGIFQVPILSPQALSLEARRYLLMRCDEIDGQVVSDAVEMMIGPNANWVVSWGVLTGAILGTISKIIMWFSRNHIQT